MNRQHDRLMPITLRPTKAKSSDVPNLADIVQVNALLEKRSLKTRNKSNFKDNEHFITLASLRNKNIKYENQKQEQYHRLDRKSKIQQNTEWMDLIKNEEKPMKISTAMNPKTCFQQIKETNRQIDMANKELDLINAAMNKRRSMPINKSFQLSQSKVTLPVTGAPKTKMVVNNSNRKHVCSKGVYPDKFNDPSVLQNIAEKPMAVDDKLIDYNFSKIKSKPSHRKVNAIRNKRADATLCLVNDKIKKINNKYFNTDYETHLKTMVQKKPKYRSMKDLLKTETDKIRLSTMEASKLMQNELDKDLNQPGYKDRELTKQYYQTQVLYENLDFLENQVFHDNFSDEEKKEKNKLNVQKQTQTPRSPKVPTSSIKTVVHAADHQNLFAPKKAQKIPKKEDATSKTIETMTTVPPKSALEAAILKSDYLRKEFNMNTSETNLIAPNFMKLDSKVEKQSWSRDIEYLMK